MTRDQRRTPDAVPTLLVCFAFLVGCGGAPPAADVSELIELLQSDSDEDRYKALATLRQLGPDGSAAVTYLRDALKYTKDDDMAGEIAKTLGAMGSAAAPAVPELTAALGRTTMWPRYAAIEALGRLGPAAAPALPTLQKMTRDRDQDVAAAAHEAVRRLQRSAKTK